MDTDVLKVFAATYVKESDIDFNDKLYLVNFIKEAEKDAVLSLLANGTPDVITESEIPLDHVERWIESLVEDRVPAYGKGREWRPVGQPDPNYSSNMDSAYQMAKTAKEAGKGKGAAIAIGAAAIAAAGALAYKRFFSKAAKACKGKPDRSACVAKYKAGAQKAKAAVIAAKKKAKGK